MDPSQTKTNLNYKPVDTTEMFNLVSPLNIITIIVLFSPLILATSIFSMSFVFQNFKGFIYLAFLIAVVLFRELWIYGSKSEKFVPKNPVCNLVNYSALGNSSFSLFVISFSIAYLCWPMILHKNMNYWLLSGLLMYLLVDLGVRGSQKCFSGFKSIFVNILSGTTLATVITVLMFYGGASNYLFFNEVSSDKQICSMPKKQQFKCAVYKNGQLIGNTTS